MFQAPFWLTWFVSRTHPWSHPCEFECVLWPSWITCLPSIRAVRRREPKFKELFSKEEGKKAYNQQMSSTAITQKSLCSFIKSIQCQHIKHLTVSMLKFHPQVASYCCSVAQSGTPRTAACQVPLSFAISKSLLKFTSIESVMPSNHLILCHFLLILPSIFPRIRVSSIESALCIRWPDYWSFNFSNSPSSEYSVLISFKINWFDLLAVD